MKNLLLFAFIAISFASCEKEDPENLCPVVDKGALPKVVTSAFETKYPNVTVEKWFNKDNKGYYALAHINGLKTLVQYDKEGNFINEDVRDQGDDNQDDDDGCECDTD